MDTEISLMHMNCEGCEWELLEDLLEDPELVKKVVAVFFFKLSPSYQMSR